MFSVILHIPVYLPVSSSVYPCALHIQSVRVSMDEAPTSYDPSHSRIRKSAFRPETIFFFTDTGIYEKDYLKSLPPDQHRDMLCPETHFQCPDNGYCLPVFVRCNGVYDCPGKEDEEGCGDAVCPGYYRCRGCAVCLHPDHVCDGVRQCPEQDDELLCNLTCPEHCICLGLAFKCSLAIELPHTLRALDISGNALALSLLVDLVMLVYLDLSNCQLSSITRFSYLNLQTLSLSKNLIHTLSLKDLMDLSNLRHLSLSQNPIILLFPDDVSSSLSLPNLETLDLSGVMFPQLQISILDAFPNLQNLNLSNSGVLHLSFTGSTPLPRLQIIDLRGCPLLEFPPQLFLRLDTLQQLFGDTFKLCCPQVLPAGFNPNHCHSPVNEISSCDNLLRLHVYRLSLTLFAVFAVSGNVVSLILQLSGFGSKTGKSSGYSVFVTHLCISDGLMGVYLSIIGVADMVYQNTYLWQDTTWKNSAVCRLAGFFALLSMEMSAFIVCLITLDRFMVIQFPFSQLRFKSGSAHVVCLVHWLMVISLVCIPFLPVCSHWEFYSSTDICVPLPVTRSSFAGHSFAFGVMIVLNMVLFVAIAVGQTAIYSTIRFNTLSSTDTGRKQQDLNIARRLITIAVTDFLCWFPVGLLGLLASTGTAVPGEVNVAMATLVIPLNSAMNPFLYTVNILLEKRRQAREERILQCLKSQSVNR